MRVRALRGATTVDDDTEEQIRLRVRDLVAELFERNDLVPADVISVFVTATPDIHSFHPATAARAYGLDEVAIIGAQELDIEGTLPRCIRILMHVDSARSASELRHVFREGAIGLRPDLVARP